MRTLAVAERQILGTRLGGIRALPIPDPSSAWCHRCGATRGEFERATRSAATILCRHCAGRRLERDRTIRLGAYESHWRDAILAVKHGRDRALARELGKLLAQQWKRESQPESMRFDGTVIVPIPMPLARRIERGIDHTGEIARTLGTTLKLPVWQCLEHDAGPVQADLARSCRQSRGDRIHFRHRERARIAAVGSVLLVDDVLTTGSTLSQACRAIHSCLGPIPVTALVIAVADLIKTPDFIGVYDDLGD